MEKPIKIYKDLSSAEQIILECERIKDLLLTKNAAYGDAALNEGILFPIDSVVAIQARINDKINRIRNKGITDDTEDSIDDLIGYLILLKIALKKRTPGT
jgi:hypothetical protein